MAVWGGRGERQELGGGAKESLAPGGKAAEDLLRGGLVALCAAYRARHPESSPGEDREALAKSPRTLHRAETEEVVPSADSSLPVHHEPAGARGQGGEATNKGGGGVLQGGSGEKAFGLSTLQP